MTVTLGSERFGADALAGLDEFSYAEVVSVFDRVRPEEVGARVARDQRTLARRKQGDEEI